MIQENHITTIDQIRILIADDDSSIIKLLDTILKRDGYIVSTATNGTDALAALLQSEPPHIAILDWHMPGLSGIEVSHAHLVAEQKSYVYKVILSGTIEKTEVIEALHNGAHDVMLKPIDMNLLKSRLEIGKKIVEEQLSLTTMNAVISRYANEMERLAADRAKQLVHAERLSGLGIMAAGIAHEINNPMSFIAGNIQTLSIFWKDVAPLLVNRDAYITDPTIKGKIDFIVREMPSMLGGIMEGVERVTTIVKSLKRYSSTNAAHAKQVCDMNTCIRQAKKMCGYSIARGIEITLSLTEEPILIMGNPVELEQIFVNLIQNAADAVASSTQKMISISSARLGDSVVIHVQDSGCGIPVALMNKIWQPFVTSKQPGKGTGLGLAIIAGIVQDHKGRVHAENIPSGGARFQISLPAYQKDKSQ